MKKKHEVVYRDELAPLFNDDDPNEVYYPPFERPSHLMTHFLELEEQSLSLIKQVQ